MARSIVGTCFGALGLAAGMIQPLAAQALALPGSDAVNIGRSGTGVAFGQSLEAAALNPALLASLRDASSAYLAAGFELQCSQVTLASTQHTLSTTDRNRFLPALGGAWRLNDRIVLGVKMDDPFQRHMGLATESNTRFLQRSIDLSARRLEMQGSLAITPAFSLGVGLGVAHLKYASQVDLRAPLAADPNAPISSTNLTQGLIELPLSQTGSANALSYSLGFRWAMNPRWTLGGSYDGAIRATPSMTARLNGTAPVYVDGDGYSSADIGQYGPAFINAASARPGQGRISLPSHARLGVRHRLNQTATWEVDLHRIGGSAFELPTQPAMETPNGTVASHPLERSPRNGFGLSAMLELNLTKRWVVRAGGEVMPRLLTDAEADPMIGGGRTAAFSLGTSYRIFGGEWSLGYQHRQAVDLDSYRLDGKWTQQGYFRTGTLVRTESAGHLVSLAYKVAF
ncbi:MAG TPA: outer membrane protein transport protein [Holophaga sp.]|nr:outer membrane protein transport protein [Holophaga sp.]